MVQVELNFLFVLRRSDMLDVLMNVASAKGMSLFVPKGSLCSESVASRVSVAMRKAYSFEFRKVRRQ